MPGGLCPGGHSLQSRLAQAAGVGRPRSALIHWVQRGPTECCHRAGVPMSTTVKFKVFLLTLAVELYVEVGRASASLRSYVKGGNGRPGWASEQRESSSSVGLFWPGGASAGWGLQQQRWSPRSRCCRAALPLPRKDPSCLFQLLMAPSCHMAIFCVSHLSRTPGLLDCGQHCSSMISP
jgi:hypothetical protein